VSRETWVGVTRSQKLMKVALEHVKDRDSASKRMSAKATWN